MLWRTECADRSAFLFSQPAIVIGLVHGYLPYMILTCFIALLPIDDSLIEAAQQPRRPRAGDRSCA